jgi:hypothetical protein
VEIVAERVLELEPADGTAKQPIRIVLGKPEMDKDGAWRAPYEIHGPGEGEVLQRVAYGEDSLQALALAIYILPDILRRYERRGRLLDRGEEGFKIGLPSEIGIARAVGRE